MIRNYPAVTINFHSADLCLFCGVFKDLSQLTRSFIDCPRQGI